MLTLRNKKDILTRLRAMAKGNIKDISWGICRNLRETTKTLHSEDYSSTDYLKTFYHSWPEYTKDRVYPVPTPECYNSSWDGYHAHYNKWSGAYGDSRKALLQHLIIEIEKDIEK